MSELSFLREDKKIFKKNTSRLKYIQLEIAIIKNEILNLKIFELQKIQNSKNSRFQKKLENKKSCQKIEKQRVKKK